VENIVGSKTSKELRETCLQAPRAITQCMFVLLTATLALFMLTPIWAQTTTGTISGTVRDPSGQVLLGAQVTVTNEATGETRNANTGQTGDFIFPSLFPATYSIRVEAPGFQAFQSNGNILTPNSRLSVGEVLMKIGSVTETVTVEARTAQVDTVSAENSALLDRDQFSMLPIKGRDLTSALMLLPGVQMGADQEAFGGAYGFGGGTGAIQGTRNTQQNLMVDGIVANDMGLPSGLSGQVNMDAVSEVKVMLSNYQAEYSGNPGANISMITRSGTKEFHGGAYYFGRNEFFNANDFFRNRSDDASLSSGPALYRFHTFGGTIGGPIPLPKLNDNRDKLFFFYSIDVTRSKLPPNVGGAGVNRYTMPTALERQGDFSQSATKPIDPTTGQPFPNDTIPADRIDQNMQTLLDLYPLPNVADNGSWNYETLQVVHIPQMQHVIRIDYAPTANDRFYVRGANWHKDTHGPGYGYVGYGVGGGFGTGWPYLEGYYQYVDESLALNYTRVWSPRIISEFTSGIRRSREKEDKNDFDAVFRRGSREGLGLNLGYIFPSSPTWNYLDLIPNISYSGINNSPSIGFGTRFAQPGQDVMITVSHATTFVFDKHTLKLGVFYNNGRDIEGGFGSFSGSTAGALQFTNASTNPLNTGNPYANQLLGNFTSYTEGDSRNDIRAFRNIFEWFVQDTWKLSRKLTLDFGFRFSHAGEFYPDGPGASFNLDKYNLSDAPRLFQPEIVNGTRVAYDSITGQTLDQAYIGAYVPNTGNLLNGIELKDDPGVPRGFRDQSPIQVMPRFGFAYDLFGDGKMVIRGGGGIFAQTQGDGFVSGANFLSQPPIINLANLYNANVSVLESGTATAYTFPAGINSFERRGILPVTYSFSLGVQRDMGYGMIADVKYVGTLGRHLPGARTINALPPGARFAPEYQDPTSPGFPLPDNLIRPLRGWGSIGITERRGSSNYNSLQATLNRRFAQSLQFGIAYTFSKSLDYGSADRGGFGGTGQFPNFLPLSREYGLSTFDQPHIFVVNWQYSLPFLNGGFVEALTRGWELNGVYSASTGTPQSPTIINITDHLGGGDSPRVNLTCDPNLPRGERTVDRFFNTSCIELPGRGDYGNASKNIYRGPGRNNWDMSLMRNFNLGSEERVLTFRWELYNIFNHTQFSTIDNLLLYAAFGPSPINLNANFGKATGAYSARQMQFSLRLRF
jgi:hypothetical protein